MSNIFLSFFPRSAKTNPTRIIKFTTLKGLSHDDIAVLTAQDLSVARAPNCGKGGRGFYSWGRTNTQGLKITIIFN